MDKATAFISKSYADFVKRLSDLWNGRGWFARLAMVPRWRILLVECAMLALVCGGFYLTRYEASAARYRQTLSRTSNELRAVALEIEAERRDLDAARGRQDLLAGFVLGKESQAQLLSAMTDSAAHPGLEFVSMSPMPKQNLEKYARCRALLGVEGAFDDFLRFLRELESEPAPCSVIRIDVTSQWANEMPESISFLVETYTEADPQLPEESSAR